MQDKIAVVSNVFLGKHDNHLGLLYDWTQHSMSVLGSICLSGKINNGTSTLKKMLQQLDRNYFEQVVHDEVTAMLKNEFWQRVSKSSVNDYYNDIRKTRCGMKRKQTMTK